MAIIFNPFDGQLAQHPDYSAEFAKLDSLYFLPTPTITTNYAAADKDEVRCDSSGGTFTITLPAAGSVKIVDIVGVDADTGFGETNKYVTLVPQPGGTTILGETSLDLDVGASRLVFTLYGSDWKLIDVSAPRFVVSDWNDLNNKPNFVDSSTVSLSYDGTNVEGSLIDGSIDESKLNASVNASLNKADAGREVLTANRTYYVRTDGNDSNNGLTDSAEGAFLTLQKALNVAGTLDLSIYDVTIQLANGTYAGGTVKTAVGHGKIIIIGDTVDPSNVVVNTSLVVARCRTVIEIQGLAIYTSNLFGLDVSGRSTVHISGNCHFSAAQRDIYVQEATVNVFSSYRVDSGTRLIHVSCINNGVYSFGTAGIVITMNGTPNFTDSTINASTAGVVNIPVGRGSFSGAATGVRYRAAGNAVINSAGGGTSFIPGDAAGVVTTGGQYVP